MLNTSLPSLRSVRQDPKTDRALCSLSPQVCPIESDSEDHPSLCSGLELDPCRIGSKWTFHDTGHCECTCIAQQDIAFRSSPPASRLIILPIRVRSRS